MTPSKELSALLFNRERRIPVSATCPSQASVNEASSKGLADPPRKNWEAASLALVLFTALLQP